MFSRIFTIAKGNTTLIVWDCPLDKRSAYISDNFNRGIEQIGFVNDKDNRISFEMMGSEFSLNGSLAFSSTINSNLDFFVSGLSSPVHNSNFKGLPTILFEMPYKQIENIIVFEGIGYVLLNDREEVDSNNLLELCNKYSLPAFGALLYKDNVMNPFVYVKETNSLVEETACGSGSVALSIIKGLDKVIQPSGGTIYINKNGNIFRVSAEVNLIG